MGSNSDNDKKVESHNPKEDPFFRITKLLLWILLIIGIFASIWTVLLNPEENIFKGIGLLFTTIWGAIFIIYFRWAIFYYNINYGKSRTFWDQVFKARQKKIDENPLNQTEIDAPKDNPYRSQTFGFPPGTVRGMIAFTLLFGAISLLIVSFGLDGRIDESSFYWDHFEFFKTAFLMMIAFYFGSHSLKYLQNRFPKNPSGRGASSGSDSELGSDEASPNVDEVEADNMLLDDEIHQFDKENPVEISKIKKVLSKSETPTTANGLIPVIDAGHGGIIDGKYTSGEKKKYTFLKDDNSEDFTIYEGVVNRQIGQKLIDMLDAKGIPYKDLTVSDKEDMPLRERTSKANKIYDQNKKYYFLSIHSNAASNELKGKGLNATGFEIYTSKGQTKSDELATIAAKWYKKELSDFRFRQEIEDGDPDKEANLAVLRDTKCPAFLVENLFYDNIKEAKFLMSENGQNKIASCLYKIVEEIYYGYKA